MTEGGYRPEFLAALDLLAQASRLMQEGGTPPPILVGGAVVEFDTLGAITSGDLDLISAHDQALAKALEKVGFRREDRPGRRLGGWYHPDLPIAADCVSSHYFDGRGDRRRLRVVVVPSGEVLMAPTEDIIVDRIGQWEASGRRDTELEAQITNLLRLAHGLDDDYIRRRIKEEGGSIVDLGVFLNAGQQP